MVRDDRPSSVHCRPSALPVSTPIVSNTCPRCHEPASGKFCAHCGAALKGAECPKCSGALTPGAQFCHHCGSSLTTGGGGAAASKMPWILTGVALMLVIALVLYQASRSATDGGAAEGAAGPMSGAPMGGAARGAGPGVVDLASMSPEEKADRLFNRVMSYASEGKSDSAAIFAPMALQAFDMLGSLNVHGRYDVGLVATVAGELAKAKAQADTILKQNPNDLLGLTLAMRVAESAKNSASATDYGKRLIAAEASEKKTGREEYTAHGSDIDAAIKDARARKP